MQSSRREFVQRSSALVAGSALSLGPFIRRSRRTRLRVLGTHVTLQEPIRQRAQRELGIELEFHPGGSAQILQQASMRPDSFDVFEQWSNTIRLLWQADAIQAVDTRRIEDWDQMVPVVKTGRVHPKTKLGAGDSPHKLLHVQPDGSLGERETDRASFLPYVHNVDSFGYLSSVVPEGAPYVEESWSWLLDPRWSGRAAFVNEPTIGIFDLALAAQSAGLVQIADIGAITRAEIDALFDALLGEGLRGHFVGGWNSVPDSVALMRDRKVCIQSLFEPAVSTLREAGLPVHYAAPKEGYRAWCGVMCLSSQLDEEREDAAYRFMNWWLSGWAGAYVARQGYYISVPERARTFLSPAEWSYWYGGEPASEEVRGTSGKTVARSGDHRRGGSYSDRFSHIAVWNTVMDSYEYSLTRWDDLLAN